MTIMKNANSGVMKEIIEGHMKAILERGCGYDSAIRFQREAMKEITDDVSIPDFVRITDELMKPYVM